MSEEWQNKMLFQNISNLMKRAESNIDELEATKDILMREKEAIDPKCEKTKSELDLKRKSTPLIQKNAISCYMEKIKLVEKFRLFYNIDYTEAIEDLNRKIRLKELYIERLFAIYNYAESLKSSVKETDKVMYRYNINSAIQKEATYFYKSIVDLSSNYKFLVNYFEEYLEQLKIVDSNEYEKLKEHNSILEKKEIKITEVKIADESYKVVLNELATTKFVLDDTKLLDLTQENVLETLGIIYPDIKSKLTNVQNAKGKQVA